jgi:hypothetical protein
MIRSCLALAFCGLAMASACKSQPMEKIAKVRDAIASEDAAAFTSATEDLARCNDAMPVRPEAGCLQDMATQLGSKSGFHFNPPDQASAATAAVVLLRDKHGEWLPPPADGWMNALRTGKGPGADALRLAVARAMSGASDAVARSIDDEAGALALLGAVSASVPGACSTYALLGSGVNGARLPPELAADHSACVQRDLARKDAPGVAYGNGAFRAAEGAVALWREALRALREGAGAMEPDSAARRSLEAKLAPLEASAVKIALKKLPPPPDYSMYLTDAHRDAGALPATTPAGRRETPRLGDAGPP